MMRPMVALEIVKLWLCRISQSFCFSHMGKVEPPPLDFGV